MVGGVVVGQALEQGMVWAWERVRGQGTVEGLAAWVPGCRGVGLAGNREVGWRRRGA